MAKLIVKIGGKIASEVNFEKNPFVIGRDPKADLSVPNTLLSRQHCSISKENNRFVLTDLGSTNGTTVNGVYIRKKTLEPGDVIQIGEIEMVFVDEPPVTKRLGETDMYVPQPNANPVDRVMEAYSLRPTKRSDMLAVDIGKDSAFQGVEKASRMFYILYQISRELSTVTNLDDIMRESMKFIFEVIQAERGIMFTNDRDLGVPVPKVAYTKTLGFINPKDFQVSSTVVKNAMQQKAAIITQDALSDPRFAQGLSIVRQHIRSVLCAPLWDEQEVYGAIYIDNQSHAHAFTEEDRALLTGISNLIALRLRQEKLHGQLMQETTRRLNLSRFMSPDVVDIVMQKGGELEPMRRDVTVLFADIVDSTALAEKLEEHQVHQLLNRFYEIATNAIVSQKGNVNKFIGDAVMGLYNAPLDLPDHELRAVESARILLMNLQKHNEANPSLAIRVRIGINTGPAIAGPVGAADQLEYTVLGDVVNTAERICKVERQSPIAIGESTFAKVNGSVAARDLGELKLKGKEKAVRVFELQV